MPELKKRNPGTTRRRLIIVGILLATVSILCIIIIRSHIPMTLQMAAGNIDDIQKKIDILEEKAIAGMPFSETEKQFCIELFDTLSFGGTVVGYSEAAQMLSHYIHGKGEPIRMDSAAYRQNSTVKPACRAILLRIEQDIRKQKWHEMRRYASPTLTIDQNEDPALFYLSNIFEITAQASKKSKDRYMIVFNVKRYYEFSSYKAQIDRFSTPKRLISFFPTSVPGKILTIDDGLSHYLSEIGIAVEFDYFTQWEDELVLL